MSQELTQTAPPLGGQELESLVVKGDLSVLPPEAKARHYIAVCNSLGLNPSTQPFAYIRLNGKEVLYALRACTDQLRSIRNVAITITERQQIGDVFQVTARATLPNGRTDESIGAVPTAGLKGENLSNALMKAETKAKRRVTLSICGLGFLDETEVASIREQHFENMPQEAPATTQMARVLVHAKTEIPPVPDVVDHVPGFFCKGPFAPLSSVEGVPFAEMDIRDLELVVSVVKDNKARIKSDTGRAWATAIEAEATLVLRDMQTDIVPMPGDAP